MATCGTGGWGGPLPGDPDNNIGIRAVPAFGGIDVTWDYPGTNSHAVAHGLLYRGVTPLWENASPLVVVSGNSYYDKVETGVTYYYWIRIRSVHGTLGDEIGPASAMARPLIADLMALLTGYIDAGVLATALREQIDSIGLNHQELLDEITARVADDLALSAALAELQGGVTQALAFINSEITERVAADSALIEQVDTLAALNATSAAAVITETAARVNADEAIAEQITQLLVADQAATAALAVVNQASITANAVLANQITTAEATLNGNLAAVAVELSTNINAVGDTVDEIGALYTVRVGVNGLAGGFGIYNDGTEVQAGFDVDLFWIGRTAEDGRKPFIILNDEVFIDEAAINSLVIGKLRDEAGTFVVADGKIKTEFIETRGLTIRDAAGNIILGSGTGLDWAQVVGANRPQNNATYGASFGVNIGGQITAGNASTYIANLAVGNAQIGNAAITSAKIGNAAIGYAHIGQAEVGTLTVDGNAITVPSYGSAAGYSVTLTLTMDQPGTILLQGVCSGMYLKNGGLTARLEHRAASPAGAPWVEIANSFNNSQGGVNPIISIPVMAAVSVPAGGRFLRLTIDATSGENEKCSLVATGVKR